MDHLFVEEEHQHCRHERGAVLTQDEADAIVTQFDLANAVFIIVHRVAGYRGGVQALLQPVWATAWEH